MAERTQEQIDEGLRQLRALHEIVKLDLSLNYSPSRELHPRSRWYVGNREMTGCGRSPAEALFHRQRAIMGESFAEYPHGDMFEVTRG